MNNQSATMNTKDNPLGYKKESTLLVGCLLYTSVYPGSLHIIQLCTP